MEAVSCAHQIPQTLITTPMVNFVREQMPRCDASRMISQAREMLCESAELQELMSNWNASTVYEALQHAYGGVTNGFLSEVCAAISGRLVEVVGEAEERFPCPCCGRRTLTELHDARAGTGYDICDHC